jgi:hypothetical protein
VLAATDVRAGICPLPMHARQRLDPSYSLHEWYSLRLHRRPRRHGDPPQTSSWTVWLRPSSATSLQALPDDGLFPDPGSQSTGGQRRRQRRTHSNFGPAYGLRICPSLGSIASGSGCCLNGSLSGWLAAIYSLNDKNLVHSLRKAFLAIVVQLGDRTLHIEEGVMFLFLPELKVFG